jgi:hypothetical protein
MHLTSHLKYCLGYVRMSQTIQHKTADVVPRLVVVRGDYDSELWFLPDIH